MQTFVLTGNADACRYRLEWYKQGFQKKYGADASIERLDVEDIRLAQLQDILWSRSLFGGKRMVIVRGLPLSTTMKKKEVQEMEEYLKEHWAALDEETVYIFVTPDADKRRSLMKWCIKEKIVEQCTAKEGVALTELIRKLLPGVAPELLRILQERVGNEEQQIRASIDKLLLYAGNDVITKEMVLAVTTMSDEPDIFGLMDALSARNLQKSLHALHGLLENGEDIFMILSMCIRQFRIMYALTKATDRDAMQKALKLHPFVAKKTTHYLKNFPAHILREGYYQLHTLDRDVKTGVIRGTTDDQRELQIALERFIVDVCVQS